MVNLFLLTQKPSLAKKKIVHWTSYDPHKRVNAAFLMGSYVIVHHDKTPDEAFRLVQHGPAFVTFRLVVHNPGGHCLLELMLHICSLMSRYLVCHEWLCGCCSLQGCISAMPDILPHFEPLLLSSFEGGQSVVSLCLCT